MHGYEITKEIAKSFNGAYEPSPGVVYPTLQWLGDAGYVQGRQDGGKTVYHITDDGAAYLDDNRERLSKAVELLNSWMANDRDFPILKSAARLERTIRICLPELTKDKRAGVARILDEASERVIKLVNEA